VVRIYLPYVSSVIESLSALSAVKAEDSKAAHFYAIFTAHSSVGEFLFKSIWSGNLRVCIGPGNELIAALDRLMEGDDMAEPLPYWKVVSLNNAINSFRTVLEAEFQTYGIFLVTAKRGYDITTLLDTAEKVFPPEIALKMPQIVPELREAGRCLAFALGTAAAFHLLRALESVVCVYWSVVMNGRPLPTNRNLGQYIIEMAKGNHADRKKVLFALRQVKDLHRNSIMHPEETLDIDQAISLMNTVQSAITQMLPFVDGKKGVELMENSAKIAEELYEADADSILLEDEKQRKALKGSNPQKRLGKGKDLEAK
jgi:hypothetical protein